MDEQTAIFPSGKCSSRLRGRAFARGVVPAFLLFGLMPFGLAGCQSSSHVSNIAGTGNERGFAEKGAMASRGSGAVAGRADNRPNELGGGNRENLASLNEVVRANPSDVNALNMRGTAFAKSRQFKMALADLNAAIELDPQYYQVYANRALVYINLRRFEMAKADFEAALRLNPQYVVAYLGRGRLYKRERKYAIAQSDFSRVIKLDPSNASAYFQRALTYQFMGQHANAITAFDVAISLRPNRAQPYFGRGQSRFALQKYELAYDDFYIAAKRGNGNPRAWTFRGLSAERFGDPKKAVRAYRRALQSNPKFKPAIKGMKRLGVKAA
ncbi:MAG: tetratricopeptide repeat protein [Hyphomicrobiaceae bacterium]|nr:tetratricopeptide repeat protein [Hyphomicrobiaceae bacterium]